MNVLEPSNAKHTPNEDIRVQSKVVAHPPLDCIFEREFNSRACVLGGHAAEIRI